MSKVAVISDIGGWAKPFQDLLEKQLNVTSGKLPEDLSLVINGDLVHKGPDSDEVLDIVKELLHLNGDKVQVLVGNHEANYIAYPRFWEKRVSKTGRTLIRDWWSSGLMKSAVAVDVGTSKDYLITHAGLTYGFWDFLLCRPQTAVEAAERIRALEHTGSPWLWKTGVMISGTVTYEAGPVWASSSEEVYPSWREAEILVDDSMPFHQVHGHSTPYDWLYKKWRISNTLRSSVSLLENSNISVADIASSRFISVDPGHGSWEHAQDNWKPYMLSGRLIVPDPKLIEDMEWLI